MALHNFLKADKSQKILILGSGALTIGQAGEFDYSGSQAVAALEEEGFEVIIVNPNIATVQTNSTPNRKVYLSPVSHKSVEKIIQEERPVAILGGFGGQTALNCLIDLAQSGCLEKYNVKSLGTSIETLITTEDRQVFSRKLESLGIKTLPFKTFISRDEVLLVIDQFEFPVIVRSAFALGGLGSGFANNKAELLNLVEEALQINPQVIIERSIAGWKELEYEVLRDSYDNTICICNLENLDPLGIHTGDSVVVAPSQTLNNEEVQLLRDVSIRIVKSLNIIGECNVQFALDPNSLDYYVIEVNARLSRSSALASKATGYPIAYIAAKVVLGYSLLELKNPTTTSTTAFFEPSLDYITIKFPKWDLNKFIGANRRLGSKMKSVGEVMSIGRTFPEAFQKAVRMVLENETGCLFRPFHGCDEQILENELKNPTDKRIFAIIESLNRNYTVEKLHELTKITHWFLYQIKKIVDITFEIQNFSLATLKVISKDKLENWKKYGFSDAQIAKIVLENSDIKISQDECVDLIRDLRDEFKLRPFVKKIDTTSSEFPTTSNYLYLTYNASCSDVVPSELESYLLLGSGPYRIGSSVEFDWCGVSASLFLKSKGLGSIVLNCNPETVSTDFNISSRLYFEELSSETVLDIVNFESPKGVVGCFGGQIANNLILQLKNENIKILGHSSDSIELAENRTVFSKHLDSINIKQPRWVSASRKEDIQLFVQEIGLPVLIRPSFVLSGTAMKVAYDHESLESYLREATVVSNNNPVILTEYLTYAKEFEVDGVAKDGEVVIDITSEHIENAGVHSGDATIVLPVLEKNEETLSTIKEYTTKIVKILGLNGPFNIQYIVKNNLVMVIECNARASRSFPFVSKVLEINLAELALSNILNLAQNNLTKSYDLSGKFAVKASMFSFNRLEGVDPVQGVEMTSTGEVGCIGKNFNDVYVSAMEATGIRAPKKGILISAGSLKEKENFIEVIPYLKACGVPIFATKGTADFFKKHNLKVEKIDWDEEGNQKVLRLITFKTVDLVINIPKNNFEEELFNNSLIRQSASISNCSLITNAQKAIKFFHALNS